MNLAELDAELSKDPGYVAAGRELKPLLDLGDSILMLRTRWGMSLRSLACGTGYRKSYLRDIEAGLADPKISHLRRIAAELDATLEVRMVPKPWGAKKARDAVSDFLSANPVVDAVLERAKTHIGKWFPGAPVCVYLQDDECGGRELVAEIVSRYDVAETRSRLDGFDEEWWLAVASLVAGKLVIDVGYTEVIES
jgi:transcriptional regulator with XRE-family HTH domain